MKKIIITLGSTATLATALFLSGCTTTEETKTATPAASPVAVASPSAAPTEAPKADATASVTKAIESLKAASTELKNKNAKGAADNVMAAKTALTAAMSVVPVVAKPALESASKLVDGLGPMVEKNTKDAGVAIDKATTALDKLLPMLKVDAKGVMSTVTDAAKSATSAVADKAAEAGKSAVDATKDATKAVADKAKEATGAKH